MMMTDLLSEIEAYLAARERAGCPIAPSTFGREAVNDGKLLKRLENGNEIMRRTEAKVRAYIAQNPPEAVASRAGEAA